MALTAMDMNGALCRGKAAYSILPSKPEGENTSQLRVSQHGVS